MRTVKIQELLEFIHAQPPERQVDMGQPLTSDPCGCVMVHFGQENIPELSGKDWWCLNDNWRCRENNKFAQVCQFEGNLNDFGNAFWRAKTYGEMQEKFKTAGDLYGKD